MRISRRPKEDACKSTARHFLILSEVPMMMQASLFQVGFRLGEGWLHNALSPTPFLRLVRDVDRIATVNRQLIQMSRRGLL